MHRYSVNNRGSKPACIDAAERPKAGEASKTHASFGAEALGRLVRSKAGHDKDDLLVIVAAVDEAHVLVADGRLRTIEKPKKKKLRHIMVLEAFSKELNQKLVSGSPVQNAELRKFIAKAMEESRQ